MLIQPKVRGFICTAAHPIGCAKAVEEQIRYVISKGSFDGPKRVLILGASTGYGLASRVALTFGANAKTIGVAFERPAEGVRTASPGWYNTMAFERFAQDADHYARSINGDAFSTAIKQETANLIRQDLGQVDLIIYSLASPRRVHPVSGHVFSSVLKPIGQSFTGKTVDPMKGEVKEITLQPAIDAEIEDTIAVMGGEDWAMWMDFLANENLLADGIATVAYDYVGPQLTYPIYKQGTIGAAKAHLHETAIQLNKMLEKQQGRALLSVNKALVTQASSAIPVVPLYISLLYKIMKKQGTHEGCIEQMYRLFSQKFLIDPSDRIRMDDWEMADAVQDEIKALWPIITTENLEALTDIEGYRDDFYRLFGFHFAGIDYEADVEL